MRQKRFRSNWDCAKAGLRGGTKSFFEPWVLAYRGIRWVAHKADSGLRAWSRRA